MQPQQRYEPDIHRKNKANSVEEERKESSTRASGAERSRRFRRSLPFDPGRRHRGIRKCAGARSTEGPLLNLLRAVLASAISRLPNITFPWTAALRSRSSPGSNIRLWCCREYDLTCLSSWVECSSSNRCLGRAGYRFPGPCQAGGVAGAGCEGVLGLSRVPCARIPRSFAGDCGNGRLPGREKKALRCRRAFCMSW